MNATNLGYMRQGKSIYSMKENCAAFVTVNLEMVVGFIHIIFQ